MVVGVPLEKDREIDPARGDQGSPRSPLEVVGRSSLILQTPLLTTEQILRRWLGTQEVVDLGVNLESLPLVRRVIYLLGPRDRGQKRG